MLAPDWLERMAGGAGSAPDVAAVACKMVELRGPGELYDAGDVLRRDGVCEQRGRFERDDGRFDEPGEVFAACAGAALYRRGAVLDVGGFDERFFLYLEDVDLGLRLRLAGWGCRYEPVVARHAGRRLLRPSSPAPHGAGWSATRCWSWPGPSRSAGRPTSSTASSPGPRTPPGSGASKPTSGASAKPCP